MIAYALNYSIQQFDQLGVFMETNSLHREFGQEITGVDLRGVTEETFTPIRDAFERHSVLLFRGQSLDDESHKRFARFFGVHENRDTLAAGTEKPLKIFAVSNETQDGLADPESMQVLNQKANMLWHTDGTFLPVPSLVNVLVAKAVVSQGGETELVSTRVAWAAMPEPLKSKLRDKIIWHRMSHSRARISPELARHPRFTRWTDRPWRSVWPNPVTGEEALYIASHAFAIEGMGLEESQALIDEAIEFCTQEQFVYVHKWQEGDVLLWDERATMHRGRPWDLTQPRTMKTVLCSASDADGLDRVRVV